MRILLITDNHTPSGGAEHYFFDLKNRLKRISAFEIFSLGFGPKEVKGNDFLVLKSAHTNMAKLIWRMFFHPIVYLKLRNYIRKIKPDVIHLHNTKQYTVSLLKAIKPYPVVQTIHDYSYICPTAQNIHKNHQPCLSGLRKACFWQHQVKYNKLIYLFLSYVFFQTRKKYRKILKKCIAPSPLLADYLKKNQFQHVTYIPPFKTEKENISFQEINPYQFLFAGNLGTHKGIYLLINEFALACQKNTKLILSIAGKGPEEERLKQCAKTLGIENNVIFLGWQDDMSKLYHESIAIIFPSIGLEAFGLVMTEAMNHARPIIGINRGTAAWIINDKKTGLLFDPNLQGDLAAKILSIAGNIDFARTLGKNGFHELKQLLNNDESLKMMIEVYKEVVGKPG